MNTNQVNWAGEVATAISAMKEETQKAYTYLKQEAPEVGAEYIKWKMVSGFAGATPLFIGAIIACVAAWKSFRKWEKERIEVANYIQRGDWGFAALMAIVAASFMFVGAFASASKAMKCIVAPRIVLIEGIKEIVK